MNILACEIHIGNGLESELERLGSLANSSLKVFWDLDSSIAPLLKLMGYEKCKQLYETKKCKYDKFELFYIPSKVFSIGWTNFYDVEQYFLDNVRPESLEETQELANRLSEALHKMGFKPSKLTSPIAIYEEQVMRCLVLPSGYDIPKEACEMAWKCSGKLWIECYQIGKWNNTYDYDIVSSFPSVAKDLIDFRDRYCEWFHADFYVSEAIYGYCEVEVSIDENIEVSPIIYETEDGKLETPTGTWHTYLTKAELDFIVKWNIGTWVILDGWWCIPKDKTIKPLQTVMNRLLSYKDSDNEVVESLAKRMSVGVYGKFGEEWQESFGPYFNPVWFAEISTQVRLEVAEFIYRYRLQRHVIHVSVDGVLLDKEVTL